MNDLNQFREERGNVRGTISLASGKLVHLSDPAGIAVLTPDEYQEVLIQLREWHEMNKDGAA